MNLLIGIAGGSGSGKTTFAKKIVHGFENEVSLIHLDSYYLPEICQIPLDRQDKPNFDHPNAFDWQMINSHISELLNGQEIQVPVYNFKSNSRMIGTQTLRPRKIIIIEGIYALYEPEIRKAFSIKCFLHVDADIRLSRRLHRDFNERGRSYNSIIDQYYQTVRPMYKKFIEPQRDFADLIIGEETDIAAKIIRNNLKFHIMDSKFEHLNS